MSPPRGRRPPPWWPESEAWPPRRRPPWAGRRHGRRFFLPIALLALGLWLLSAASLALAGWLVISLIGPSAARPQAGLVVYPLAAIVIVGLFLAFLALRGLARTFTGMSRRLDAQEERRRSFLADVAHELKTPLSVIQAQAEGIADGVYAAGPEAVAPILDAARTLSVLIEDLRTVALTESGALTLTREPVDLAVLVNDVFAIQLEGGPHLQMEIPADLPPADADPVRLRGVLNNLIANAVRHTPASGIVIVAAAAIGKDIEVTVRDTGTGVSAELQPRLFDRFVRGPDSKGSGLGLAIARDVVEAHGGVISAESRAGQGTTVRFTLPSTKF